MKTIRNLLLSASLILLLPPTWGQESTAAPTSPSKADIQGKLRDSFPAATISPLEDGPYPEIFQFVMDGKPTYIDKKGRFIFSGVLYDLKERRNFTNELMEKLLAIDTKTLPKDLAIKIVRGNGKRVIWSFEDPNCGYCKKLQGEISALNNVTNYVLMVPILSPDSREKIANIWCAPDRTKAYTSWMKNGIAPPPNTNKNCNPPMDRFDALVPQYKISGTPTLVFENKGKRVGGYITSDQMNNLLDGSDGG